MEKMNEDSNKYLEFSLVTQQLDQPLASSNVRETKQAHESSNSKKEKPQNAFIGEMSEDLQIVPTNPNNRVWMKVLN